MRSGKLRHLIEIERASNAPNDYGTPVTTWTVIASLRAEVVSRSTEEFIRDAGASDVTAIVFRTRFLGGITNADRVAFNGQSFNIREATPIGNDRGLELRCTAPEAG